jgi:Protein of unknown function (DUF3617)
MRGIVAACGLVLIGIAATSAGAAELPARKPGLWEVKMSFANRGGQTVQQCVDAATDQMLASLSGPFDQALCAKRDVQRSADRTVIDSTCRVAGKTATAHAVITGSFDSAYSMTVTAHSDALPGGTVNMTLDGKWLGACMSGQKPGDVIMPGGIKVNIRDLQKLGIRPPGAPLPN